MKAKKIFKGMTAAAIAAVLAASMVPMTAFAADDPGVPNLTINAIDDSTDATVKVYKVFDAEVPTGTTGTIYRYSWATGFSKVTVGGTEYDVDDIAGLTSDTPTVKSVAAALARQATSATPINARNTTLGTGLTLEDVGAGYYLIVYSTGDTNKIIDPVLVSITDSDAEQSAKVAPLTVDKTITEVDGGTTYVSGTGESGVVGAGSTVKYKITTTIPKYDAGVTASDLAITGIDNVGFVITDTPGAGISLSTDQSKATVSYVDLDPITTNDYTIAKDGDNLVIKFTKAATIENAGQTVTVDITADITADINSDNANLNTAKIEFANDYSTGKGYSSDDDDAKVYSTKLKVQKIDGTTREKLDGAKFTLTPKSGTPGSVRNGITQTISGDVGVLVFEDLAPGTYTLQETEVPAGGNYTLAAPVEITINASANSGEFTVNSFTYSGTDDSSNTITVKNYAGQLLPGTGGVGTTIFTIAGVGVVLVAGAMLVVYMRKRRTEDEE